MVAASARDSAVPRKLGGAIGRPLGGAQLARRLIGVRRGQRPGLRSQVLGGDRAQRGLDLEARGEPDRRGTAWGASCRLARRGQRLRLATERELQQGDGSELRPVLRQRRNRGKLALRPQPRLRRGKASQELLGSIESRHRDFRARRGELGEDSMQSLAVESRCPAEESAGPVGSGLRQLIETRPREKELLRGRLEQTRAAAVSAQRRQSARGIPGLRSGAASDGCQLAFVEQRGGALVGDAIGRALIEREQLAFLLEHFGRFEGSGV